MTGDIWLGDVARALAEVRPQTGEQVRSITRMLGFAAPQPDREQDPDPGPRPARATRTGESPGPHEPEAGDPDDSGASARQAEATGLPLLTPVGRQPVSTVGWGPRSLPRVNASLLGSPPARAPLLAPRGAATILQAMIARSTAEGPLDVPAIVDLLARRQVIGRLPQAVRPTLRFGVEILVDLGLSMEPFAGDQDQVVALVRAAAGTERASVTYFADAPGRGAGAGAPRDWQRYAPPEPGTRVLILSDFGLGGPRLYGQRSHPEEWRELVGDLRRAECDAVALLPVPPDRWPPWLTALLPLVCWDRTATASTIASSLRGS